MGNVPDVTPGNAQTFQSYDKPWANVSNAPFRLYKHYVHEGGISTPLVAHWPNGFNARSTAHEVCHVADILPTVLDATGTKALTELDGHAIQAVQGESFLPLLQNQNWQRQVPVYFEHEGNAAVRDGAFKLVKLHGGDWELYDMEADRTELHNIATGNDAIIKDLQTRYQHWADEKGVLDWNVALPVLLNAWKLTSADG
jgi:arylsulfatase